MGGRAALPGKIFRAGNSHRRELCGLRDDALALSVGRTPKDGVRGARTVACHVGTRADAWWVQFGAPRSMRTRPAIIFSLRNHTRFHRIVLDIGRNAAPLILVSDP